MKWIAFLLVAVATLAGVVAIAVPASVHADEAAAPIFVTEIPAGCRDWKLYPRIRQKGRVQDATFEIEFLDPGVEAFSFTFG
jgi:thioredoxin family protein